MVAIENDPIARLPDLQIGTLPPLRQLVERIRNDSRFLYAYLQFLTDFEKLGGASEKPSYWPLFYGNGDVSVNLLVALHRWGPNDCKSTTLRTREAEPAIVYLSGDTPVLYRVIGHMSPKLDSTKGAPVPASYAAAVAYHAAYEQSEK